MLPAAPAHITMQHPFFWPQTSSSSSVYAVSLGSNSRTCGITLWTLNNIPCEGRDVLLTPMPHALPQTSLIVRINR